jgi:hypothetical protein
MKDWRISGTEYGMKTNIYVNIGAMEDCSLEAASMRKIEPFQAYETWIGVALETQAATNCA